MDSLCENDLIDIQLAEYTSCNEGYNSRDEMVFWQFSVLITIFSVFLTFITYSSSSTKLESQVSFILVISLSILGGISLLGITKDMLATHSSKVAIRERMIEIENILNQNQQQVKLEYLFSWDEIPGNDNERIIEFLKDELKIEWAKTENISKIDDAKTIIVSNNEKSLSLKLNDDKTKVNLKIDDGRFDEFTVKTENGKLNIYKLYIKLWSSIIKNRNKYGFEKFININMPKKFENEIDFLNISSCIIVILWIIISIFFILKGLEAVQ